MGLEVTETFKVTEAGLDELDHYEVTNAQGGVIDGGINISSAAGVVSNPV